MTKVDVTTNAPLRRVPRQERGERRFAAILNAAEEVIAAVGYEAATTNAIAAQAHIPIGSLYQFFPNKEAIVRALSDRYLADLRVLFDRVFTPDTFALPVPRLLDGVIDPLVAFYVKHPGFKQLFATSGAPPRALPPSQNIDREVVARVERMLAARAPELDAARRLLYATVCTHIVEALLPLMGQDDVAAPEAIVAEIKHVLSAYMEFVLGPAVAGCA